MLSYSNECYPRRQFNSKGTFLYNLPKKPKEFDIHNISATGMSITTDSVFRLGEKIFVEIKLSKFLSEFVFHLQGEIIKVIPNENGFIYEVKFVDISHGDMVHIDELIRHKPLIDPKDIGHKIK